MKAKILILTLFLFALSGCVSPEEAEARKQQRVEQDQQRQIEWVQKVVPNGATDIADMGNGWWTFSLTSEGKTRRFLWSRHGSGENSTECITEISPSDTPVISGSNQ